MFKSKTSTLIATIIMASFAIYLIVYVVSRWNELMENDRMLLFMRILITVFVIYKAIDYLSKWRNWGKSHTDAE